MSSVDDPIEGALASAFVGDDSQMRRLEMDLARRADGEGILDVTYRIVDSPHGPLLVAATDRGVARVAFAAEGHDAVLEHLASVLGPRILRSGCGTDEAARQLDDYFARRRRQFDVPLDLRLVRGFRREVVERLPDIAYGSTASYGDVARLVGNPQAVRAVGSACANNPVPLIVPCHRVVRSDGTIGAYLGGTETKRALLAMEAG